MQAGVALTAQFLSDMFFNRKDFEGIKVYSIFASAILEFFKWSIRLVVRTSGFHPGNRGSIPLWTTIY